MIPLRSIILLWILCLFLQSDAHVRVHYANEPLSRNKRVAGVEVMALFGFINSFSYHDSRLSLHLALRRSLSSTFWATIDTPAKHHLNGVSLAGRWLPQGGYSNTFIYT